jgi:Flp pilus assembly protein TadG
MYSVHSGRPACAHARGAALIEFALTLPLFVAVLLAIIDFSNYLNDRAVLTAAAYNGAKQGDGRLGNCGAAGQVQQGVNDTLTGMLSVPGEVSTPEVNVVDTSGPKRVTVTVEFTRNPSMMSVFTAYIDTFETLSVRGVAVCQE